MGIFPMSNLNPNILCLQEAVNSNVKDVVISHRDYVEERLISSDDHVDLEVWNSIKESISSRIRNTEGLYLLPIGSALTKVMRSASNA